MFSYKKGNFVLKIIETSILLLVHGQHIMVSENYFTVREKSWIFLCSGKWQPCFGSVVSESISGVVPVQPASLNQLNAQASS